MMAPMATRMVARMPSIEPRTLMPAPGPIYASVELNGASKKNASKKITIVFDIFR